MFESVLKHLKAVAQQSKDAYLEGRYDLDEASRQALDELGLPYHCNFAQVKKRYFELCREFHPDMQQEIDNARFLRIKDAYEQLRATIGKKERND